MKNTKQKKKAAYCTGPFYHISTKLRCVDAAKKGEKNIKVILELNLKKKQIIDLFYELQQGQVPHTSSSFLLLIQTFREGKGDVAETGRSRATASLLKTAWIQGGAGTETERRGSRPSLLL